MRVLLTVPSLDRQFGGPIEKARALRAALRHLGCQVRLAGAGEGHMENDVELPAPISFHGTPVPLGLPRIVSAVRRADLVHVIGYRDPVGTMAALVARALKVPYLLEPVGMHRRRIRSIRLKAAFDGVVGHVITGGAKLVLATSRIEARELIEDGIPAWRIVTRANGIDVDGFRALPSRGNFRARLGLPRSTPLVLSLGRITRKKGLPLLVEAIARLPEVHLAIVGPDAGDGTGDAIREKVTGLGLQQRVHVLADGLWGGGKLEAFVDADLFCLFSQTENFGSAPGEAAASGTATIISDRCGLADWLPGGVEVVPYGDVKKLAETLAHLLRDGDRRGALAERGRTKARSLTWDAVARRQRELYQRVLGEG